MTHDHLRRWTIPVLLALLAMPALGAGCAGSRAGQGAAGDPAAAGFRPAMREPPQGTLSPEPYVALPPAPRPAPATNPAEQTPTPPVVPAPPPTPSSTPADADVVPRSPAAPELPAFGSYVHVEELPEAITRVAAVYPAGAEVWGIVMTQVLVDSLGDVRETRIVKSISELDSAAVRAVRQWKFKPARIAGRPVAVWVAVPVRVSRP